MGNKASFGEYGNIIETNEIRKNAYHRGLERITQGTLSFLCLENNHSIFT